MPPIRDILLFAIAAGAIPFILQHPWIGVLFSTWFGLMNPHRLTWGPAYDFRFSLWLAVVTLIGMVITRDERRWKGGVEVYLLMAFIAWYVLTTVFAFNLDRALPALERAVKVQVLVFLTLILINSKRQLDLLVWTIALSIGFYGLKGGIYTLRTGAEVGRVWGPAGSFIEDNNAMGLALVLAIPYLYYLFAETKNRWVKLGLVAVMGTSVVAAVGTYSRGTFLAIVVMGMWLWWKSRHKLLLGVALALTVPLLIAFLPGKWEDRMRSITEYQQDSSAMGRLNAWQTAINVASDHPVVGGGFEFHSKAVFERYAPVPEDFHSMHSIYFQVLGEHGFVGLALFLSIWFFSWLRSMRLARMTRTREDLRWANNLVLMVQVSLVGYLVGGAFLDLAYWDLPYYGLAILIITRDVVHRTLPALTEATPGRTQGQAPSPAVGGSPSRVDPSAPSGRSIET